MEHPAEHMTMVDGRGEPNSLPGTDLDCSRKVHELEDLVCFEKVMPHKQHVLLLCSCPEFLKRIL